MVLDARASAGQSQPAKKVPGAGSDLWYRVQVPVPVRVNRRLKCRCRFVVPGVGAGAGESQPATKVPGAGTGLRCRVPRSADAG